MTYLYSDEDLWQAYRQRRILLSIYFGSLALFLLFAVGIFTYYCSLPYNDPNMTWVKWVTYAVTVLFVVYSFIFLGIKVKRVCSYYKMLRYISLGLKEYSTAPFLGIEDWTTKDGVDVNVATFSVPSVKRNETLIRQIFIDGEKDYPPFYEGDVIKFISQGNLLLAYEIVEKAKPAVEGEDESTEKEEKGE